MLDPALLRGKAFRVGGPGHDEHPPTRSISPDGRNAPTSPRWGRQSERRLARSRDETRSARLLLAFGRRRRGLLLLAEILARLLVHLLHGEPHLAAIVEAQELDLHGLAFDDRGKVRL